MIGNLEICILLRACMCTLICMVANHVCLISISILYINSDRSV